MKKEKILEKINANIGNDDCWNWDEYFSTNGYGQVRYNGPHQQVHRVAWELMVGEIPDGLCVLHKCDNRKCYNPTHLFLGTKKDNAVDKVNKNRQLKGPDIYGAKLNYDIVAEIRSKYIPYKYTTYRLAKEYGVGQVQIYRIVKNKEWKTNPSKGG